MDTNIAHKIARAFVHGLAFAKGMATLAQDAKAKMEEGDKWITIGAEPGDDGKKHGGRHVLISGTGEVKAGLSKSAQGKPLGEAVKELKDKAESKKAEGKKAEKENLSYREMARRHSEQKAAEAEREAGRSAEEKDKAAQLSNKLNMQLFSYYDSVREATEDIERSVTEQLQLLDKSGNRAKDDLLMSALHGIDSAARTSQMFLRDYYRRVVAAAEKGKIDSTRADKELDAFKNLADETQSLTSRMKAQIAHIDDPRYNKRGDRAKIANEMRRIAKKAEDDIHNSIRDRVQDLEKAESKKAESKKAESKKAESKSKTKSKKSETPSAGALTEKASTEQANQVTNDDKKALKQIKDLVPKIGPVFHQAKSDLEFYSPSEKRGILKEVGFPDAEVTENIKYLNKLDEYVKREKEVQALAKDLNAAIKSGKLTPEDRNIYVRNLKYGFDELTKGIQRGAHAMYNYAERANRGGYVSRLDDQWIRRAVEQARGGWIYIKWTANTLKASQPSISSESDRVDAMYAQKGGKPKQRIIN